MYVSLPFDVNQEKRLKQYCQPAAAFCTIIAVHQFIMEVDDETHPGHQNP